ncbi:MAG: alanine-tRNA synthetase second additional domain-containing protein [Clostridia bacterium]|nr:alanine-tRNA synthetase second additional domain-containing protein [Clostridia bacterium]
MQELQRSHIISRYFAPRGRDRMYALGIQLSQLYLSPSDKLIGFIGEAGSGKSMIIKGMFPGIELTNDDDGVNVRPLPLLNQDLENRFFTPHTYHLDIRFENAFTQMNVLADAIWEAINRGKRVIVEHFDLIYPFLKKNADLLVGVGEEIIITRPNLFGPFPQEIYDVAYTTLPYRLMAHTAEDLCELVLGDDFVEHCTHGDVRHGFILAFNEEENIDIAVLEKKVNAFIAQDLPVTYKDDQHITIGETTLFCTGPRTHVKRTSDITGFRLLPYLVHDRLNKQYLLVGCVGEDAEENLKKLEQFV